MSVAVRGLLARALFLLCLVAAANLAADPFDVWGWRLVEPVVLSTRQTKLALSRARRPAPEIVVLGSSRTFNMDPAYIAERTGRPAFNAAVHAASTRDYLDFARCFDSDGRFPPVLVVAYGIEQFRGPSRPVERRDPLAACSGAGASNLGKALEDRIGFLTLEETWATLRIAGMELTHRPPPLYGFEPNGMMRSSFVPPLPQALANSLAGNWSPRAFVFESLHPEPLENVRLLLELARSHGSRVVAYLPPYHPQAVARYREESRFTELRAALDAQFAAWANTYPVRFHDLSEAGSFGATGDMFTDASHPDPEGCRHLVDALVPDLAR